MLSQVPQPVRRHPDTDPRFLSRSRALAPTGVPSDRWTWDLPKQILGQSH